MQLKTKAIFILVILWLFSNFTFAQQPDSTAVIKPLRYTSHQLIVPASLMVLGTGTSLFFKDQIKYYIRDERNKHFPNFYTSVDNYLQYAPIPIAYALDLVGFKSKTDIVNRSVILFKGELLMLASTNILKYATRETRPDNSSTFSFPSGHTSQAFAAATFLSEEYKERFPWMPYVAYSMATTTGILRVAKNRHYIGDVLFGAGLGILSMKVAYWTHQYKWGQKKQKVMYKY